MQSIFVPSGSILFSVGRLSLITTGGLIKGVMMVLRMTIVLVSASIMTTSTSREIVQGFVQWKVPYEIAFMVSVAVRFLPMLTEEIRDTLTALQLRGVEIKRIPAGKRIRVYSYLFMPVILGTIVKSQELSTAMEMRAFRAYPKRTSYMVLKMNPRDYAVIAASIIACTAVLVVYYLGIGLGGIL
jgi:energy-coupling factor transport system permease protein